MLLNEEKIRSFFHGNKKFINPLETKAGEERAFVDLKELKTLWFNTGTLCNLSCENCYIESSPVNDALVYITKSDVEPYLKEIKALSLPTERISFTGGEPFLNKEMITIAEMCLEYGFEVSILTNAYRAIDRHINTLGNLSKKYPKKLFLRISFDHFTEKIHENERGLKTFQRTLEAFKKLEEQDISLSIAGRSLKGESPELALKGYQEMLVLKGIKLKLEFGKTIVIFPEMSPEKDVPEITTKCWNILNKSPDMQMCSTERMIVKRKGALSPVVLPCTLLAYDKQFELGVTLEKSQKRVHLNHPFCAQFCVLGGASCSST